VGARPGSLLLDTKESRDLATACPVSRPAVEPFSLACQAAGDVRHGPDLGPVPAVEVAKCRPKRRYGVSRCDLGASCYCAGEGTSRCSMGRQRGFRKRDRQADMNKGE
jgi:hypothetical protein